MSEVHRDTGEMPVLQDPELLACTAIDQVVVDGEVDGAQKRVLHKVLVRIAFQGGVVSTDTYRGFNEALETEDRFVDKLGHQYGYRPQLSPDSVARASLLAIVKGTALCTEQETSDCLRFMNGLAETVYSHNKNRSGILALREISGTLRASGAILSYEEFGAFMQYMRQDSRFHPVADGRFVLTNQHRGTPEGVTEAARIDDIDMVLRNALPRVHASPNGRFSAGALLGTLKAQGILVRQDQMDELFNHLRSLPEVVTLDGGGYRRRKEETAPAEPVETQQLRSFEERLQVVRGGTRRKPRGKGGYKRVADMDQFGT